MAETSWVSYEYLHETLLALRVRVMSCGRAVEAWVPKSLIVGRDTKLLGVPAWFAKQRAWPAGRWGSI